MAENITTLLQLPEAEQVNANDFVYVVQGSGIDRDKKAKVSQVWKDYPNDAKVASGLYDPKPGYLIDKLKVNREFTRMFSTSHEMLLGLAPEGVQTSHIANNAITSGKIGYQEVKARNIAPNSVDFHNLAENAVHKRAIKDGSITATKLAYNDDNFFALNNLSTDTIKPSVTSQIQVQGTADFENATGNIFPRVFGIPFNSPNWIVVTESVSNWIFPKTPKSGEMVFVTNNKPGTLTVRNVADHPLVGSDVSIGNGRTRAFICLDDNPESIKWSALE